MAFAEDMTVFFNTAEFAVVATWNASTANVLFDAPSDDVLDGQVISTDYSITLPLDTFPGIGRDAAITVDGANYEVRAVRHLNDGALKRLVLTKL